VELAMFSIKNILSMVVFVVLVTAPVG